MAVARGEHKPSSDEPKVWFTSMESLAQVLSSKNALLLAMIRRSRPASIKELAELSGRKESNLSRTLKTMERYRLVRLEPADRALIPTVPYDKLVLEQEIGTSEMAILSFQAAVDARRRAAWC